MDPSRAFHSLRGVLRANAVFSIVGGVVALVAFAPVDSLLGTGSRPAVAACGLGLIVFAVFVAHVAASSPGPARGRAVIVSIADAMWCAATAALLAVMDLTLAGDVLLVTIAVIVAAFGVAQVVLVRRSAGLDPDIAVPERIHVEHVIDAGSDLVWPLLTDHDLYGRLAPNLSRVEVVDGSGVGMQRRCYDTLGRGWSERCVLWDEGSRFAVDVDTSDYPYPLDVMRGSWGVEPIGTDRSLVTMDFELVPRRGPAGALFVIVMLAAFRPVLDRIVRGWQQSLAADSVTSVA